MLFQGNPPFEKPSIAKGVTNFVLFKFGHLPQKDWQTMYDLAKMFLHCLNHWKLETPTARKQTMSSEDISAYKVCVLLCSDVKRQILIKYYQNFKFECFTIRRNSQHSFDFQVNYTRWLCYCHVPAFCDSLPHYDTTIIFGRTLLKSVFQVNECLGFIESINVLRVQ